MQTALTRLLSVRVPVVLAPMAGAAGGALAAAVTQGGGFAFVAAGASPLPSMLKELDIGRHACKLGPEDPLPFGIGLMCWRLEAPHGDPSQAEPFISAMVAAKPKAVWMSFGQELRSWVDRYRKAETAAGDHRAAVFVNASTVTEALDAKEWEGVDVVVAQGTEAGGHAPTTDAGLPIFSLVPTLAPYFAASSKILIAAGGISCSSQIVAALALGAQGVVTGTLFLATPEALYSDSQKEFILRSRGEDTTKGMRWDEARGSLGWGPAIDGRGLRNETSAGGDEIGSEEGKKLYAEAMKTGDIKRIVTWAGTSVGLVKEVKPAAEVVKELEAGALAELERLKQITGP